MSNFNYKKNWGQNFLIDETVKNEIVNSINPKKDDLIIEIGPGIGAITTKLKKYNSFLIGVEIDTDTKKYLDKLEDDKTRFIYKDFLSTSFSSIVDNKTYTNIYFIGNLPYYITTPIIEKITELELENMEMVTMVQKEVADRFLAKPHSKNYGYMTVLLNYYYDINKVCDVKKECFYPVPKVDSTVVKFIPKKDKVKIDVEKFKTFLKICFKYKRKNLKNNLNKYDLSKIEDILNKKELSLSNRAEDIDLMTFIDLFNNL